MEKLGVLLKKILMALVTTLLIAFLAFYLYRNRQDFKYLLEIPVEILILLMLFAFFSCLTNGLFRKEILKGMDVKTHIVDWLGVLSVSNVIAYVLPFKADWFASATYYKKKFGFSYSHFISIAAGGSFIGLGVTFVEILLGLFLSLLIENVFIFEIWLITILGIAGFCFSLFLVFSKQDWMIEKIPFQKQIRAVVLGFIDLLSNPSLLVKLLGYVALNSLIQIFRISLCFFVIGYPISIHQAVLYAGLTWLVDLVSIVPGNIGIKEAVLGAVSLLIGNLFGNGVLVSLILRITGMLAHFTLGLIFFPFVIKVTKKKG